MSISAWARVPGAAVGQVKASRRGCFCSCCPEQHPEAPSGLWLCLLGWGAVTYGEAARCGAQ